MAKTYLDEIIEYPMKVIQSICQSKECIALLLNKNINQISEDDADDALDRYIKTYQYVDDTVTESAAYIWVETDIPRVDNSTIKDMHLYVTIACSKDFMEIKKKIISGLAGNRRDNLVRYIDKVINGSDVFGIGKLKLTSMVTLTSSNQLFTIRELTYEVPDFNIKDLK